MLKKRGFSFIVSETERYDKRKNITKPNWLLRYPNFEFKIPKR